MLTTLEFDSRADLDAFLSALDYRRLPVAQPTWASDSFDDAGRPIITFARAPRRMLPGEPIAVRFTEMVKR